MPQSSGRRGGPAPHKSKDTSKSKKPKLQPSRNKGGDNNGSRSAAQQREEGVSNAPKPLEAKALPIPLQQLLLNVFRFGLVLPETTSTGSDDGSEILAPAPPLSELVQTIKAHLYKRDFAAAFSGDREDLLMAYALRWSAGRALGYAGIFAAVWEDLLLPSRGEREHVVCLGGGAGAEIVALAAARRFLERERSGRDRSIDEELAGLALQQENGVQDGGGSDMQRSSSLPGLSVTAVDIADWSSLVGKLFESISSTSIPSSKTCPAPLLSQQRNADFDVCFKQADILSLTKEGLQSILYPKASSQQEGDEKQSRTSLVTLMFTLNELFSTSMPKTASFLLHLTELLEPGIILLVVDSPGSYSTVTLGSKKEKSVAPKTEEEGSTATNAEEEQSKPQRRYPMRFLLEHTLLTTAAGEWECVMSDESRWFRRDAAKLTYEVGDGIGLEDMRYQIHVYKKLGS